MYTMQTHLTVKKQPSDLTDDVLVQRAHIGDQSAFEMLVDRYSTSLLLLISHLVRDEHLAHDILQHVFIQLYRSLPTLRPERSLKAWLCQVAHHRCIDELRRKRPVFFSEIASIRDGDEYSPLTTLLDPDRLPEEQVELHELRELLLEAIEALPTRFRAVVLLRYSTQLSYREIGQMLSIPEATIKRYFNRARKLLRTLLEPEFEHERGIENSK